MRIKILGGLCLALGLALATAGFEVISVKNDLAVAQLGAELMQAQLSERQAEVESLKVSVKRADEFLTQLSHERTLLDKLHSDQLSERAKLQAELATAKANVNTLRQSHDKYVKAWADTVMPADAVRLLKYAEYTGNYPDGGAASTGVSDTAGKFAGRLFT